VINRYSSHEAVTIEQIEKAVHLPIAIKISNNYSELVQAINIGEPVPADGKSDFSQQMSKWAASLAGASAAITQEPARKRFGLW
jgi:pilus assembly protein CpaE